MSMCEMFSLRKDQAAANIAVVAKVVARWKERFLSFGVTTTDIEAYAEQIERPFLRQQREEFIRR